MSLVYKIHHSASGRGRRGWKECVPSDIDKHILCVLRPQILQKVCLLTDDFPMEKLSVTRVDKKEGIPKHMPERRLLMITLALPRGQEDHSGFSRVWTHIYALTENHYNANGRCRLLAAQDHTEDNAVIHWDTPLAAGHYLLDAKTHHSNNYI